MARLASRFDQWTKVVAIGSQDLGIYRILWSVAALVLAQNVTSISKLPPSMWDPPLGPLATISSPLETEILWALLALQYGTIWLVLIGFHTTISSIASGMLIMLNDGLRYSDGKIDHATTLFALVPIVMAAARWGSTYSLDAQRYSHSNDRYADQRAVAVRYLAVLCGTALSTAALYKIPTWTQLDSRASLAHAFGNTALEGRSPLVDLDLVLSVIGTSQALWETLDWITIVLEGGLVVAALNYTVFRHWLALLCIFHLGIDALFGIIYAANPVVYAAFVPWHRLFSQLQLPRLYAPLTKRHFLLFSTVVPTVGPVAWLVAPNLWVGFQSFAGHIIILMAALMGVTYLAGSVRHIAKLSLRSTANRLSDSEGR